MWRIYAEVLPRRVRLVKRAGLFGNLIFDEVEEIGPRRIKVACSASDIELVEQVPEISRVKKIGDDRYICYVDERNTKPLWEIAMAINRIGYDLQRREAFYG